MAAIDLDAVNAKLDGASAEESIQYAVDTFGDGVAVTTSFGVQSAMMLHLATSIQPDIRIIWIDTGYLPKETYEFARDLTQRLDLNLHVYTPDLTPARIEALLGEKLWERDHKAYGKLTKVVPMANAIRELAGDTARATARAAALAAAVRAGGVVEKAPAPTAEELRRTAPCVIAALRAAQTSHRQSLRRVNLQRTPRPHYKVCPVLRWTKDDVAAYIADNKLPLHPLFHQGYKTVGDWHSSAPATGDAADELADRATRFGGKVQECGLHVEEDEDEVAAAAAAAAGGPPPDSAKAAVAGGGSETAAGGGGQPVPGSPQRRPRAASIAVEKPPAVPGLVEVFGKPSCGWCAAVKAELEKACVPFAYIDVEVGANAKALSRRAPKKRDGRIPLPQVYLEGEVLGSFPETVAAMAEIQAAQREAAAAAAVAAAAAAGGGGGGAGAASGEVASSDPCLVLCGDGWLTRRYQEYAAPILAGLTADDAEDFMLPPPDEAAGLAAVAAGSTGTTPAPSSSDKKRKRGGEAGGGASSDSSDEPKDAASRKLPKAAAAAAATAAAAAAAEEVPEHAPAVPLKAFPCSLPEGMCAGGFC